jgi:hypothetical protein
VNIVREYSFRRSVGKGVRAVFLAGLAIAAWSVAAFLSPAMPSLLIMPALQWVLVVAVDWKRHHDE